MFTLSDYSSECFLKKVEPEPNSGCWIWTGKKQSDGYGMVKINDKSYVAHVVSWCLFRGDKPDNMFVLHKCDNRWCCNPRCLFLGTQRDNMIDMHRKNRWIPNPRKGDTHPKAKLTSCNVLEILQLLSEGVFTHKEIASIFNVTRSNISLISRGLSWRHISRPSNGLLLENV